MQTESKNVGMDIENETFILKSDSSELCRLCANTDNQLIPIFKGEGIEHNIPNKIEQHLPIIKVTELDKLPLQICYQCASTLIAWHNLYEGSKIADKRLREVLCIDEKLCQNEETYENYDDDFHDDYDDQSSNNFLENIQLNSASTSSQPEDLQQNVTSEVNELNDEKTSDETENNNPSDERCSVIKKVIGRRRNTKADKCNTKCDGLMMVSVNALSKDDRVNHSRTNVGSEMPLDSKQSHQKISKCDQWSTEKFDATSTTKLTDNVFGCERCRISFLKKNNYLRHIKSTSCSSTSAQRNVPPESADGADLRPQKKQNVNPPLSGKENKNDFLAAEESFSPQPAGHEKRETTYQSVAERVCSVCGKQFTSVYNLKRHNVRVHKVKIIDEDLKSKFELLERCKIYSNDERYFKCDLCAYVGKQKHHFVEHYRIHSGERPYECYQCGKAFRRKSYILQHILHVHEGLKKYPCDICQRSFSERSFMEHHRFIHTGERPYVCDICGRMFRQSSTLKIHKLFHLGLKNYSCTICDKKFVRRGSLSVHLKRHNNQKDYLCKHCGKAFVDSTMLKEHSVVHSDKRPFSCVICGATFKLRKHLKQHGRVHVVK